MHRQPPGQRRGPVARGALAARSGSPLLVRARQNDGDPTTRTGRSPRPAPSSRVLRSPHDPKHRRPGQLPSASGTLSRVRGSPVTDVVVVGAGIVGASVAYHAACAGAAVLLIDRSLPGLLRRLLHCPWGDFRQTKDGMLLAAAGTAKKDELQRNAHATLQRLKDMLSGANDIQLSDVRIGARPMPVDGLPIVGSLPAHPGGYTAVMHSAVTLAPAAGRLVADEVIDGRELEELQGVRPHRFAAAAGTARASSDEPPVSQHDP